MSPTPDTNADAAPAPVPVPVPAKAKLTKDAARAFEHQVAGHAGQIRLLPGGILAKQTTQIEVDFLQAAPLRIPALYTAFLPPFHGSAHIDFAAKDGEAAGAGAGGEAAGEATLELAVLLGNLTAGFTKPCIADIKLGTQLYGDDASPEKRKRMEQQAVETTSGATGLRLCGVKVFHAHTGQYDVHDRSFGRSLTADQLHVGIETFFGLRVGDAVLAQVAASTLAAMVAIRDKLVALREMMAVSYTRMYGGSVLIVYEGLPQPAVADASPEPHVQVRLVDFSHAKYVDASEGPDTSLLFGLDHLIPLVNGAISLAESLEIVS
ncbi:hypothetical protein BC831DRAFT_466309 [Entophlyctis helioformis]|nr:hypothetical protein BC831DRAFT_466309 [Entophlyctis helioformis]